MAAARENEIGRCKCPVCHGDRARLRVSAKQLAYTTCDACNVQVFARSDRSDQLLRALHIPESTPAAAAPPPPPPPAPPAMVPPPSFPSTQAPPPPRRVSWGFGSLGAA